MADHHDRNYRRFFEDPRMVEDLLRGFIREPWTEDLDFSSMRRVHDVFIGQGLEKGLEKRASDIIWRIPRKAPRSREPPIYILLILEFQSTPDPWMALRLWVYLGLLYQSLIASEDLKPGDLLPPALPLVLYNGSRPWQGAQDVADLISPIAGLEDAHPRFRYLLLDERRLPLDDVEKTPNRASALFQLEQSQGPEDILRGLERLIEILPSDDPLRSQFSRWLKQVLLPSRAPGTEIPEIENLERFKTMLEESVLSWTEQWKQEGLKKGLEEGRQRGRQEGRQEGRREGERDLIRRQLERKFGVPLPGAILDRLDRADIVLLEAWGDRLLSAATLDQVFAD